MGAPRKIIVEKVDWSMTHQEIADVFSVSVSAVNRLARQLKRPRRTGGRRPVYSVELWKKVDWNQSNVRVSKKTGASLPVVAIARERYGFPYPGRPTRHRVVGSLLGIPHGEFSRMMREAEPGSSFFFPYVGDYNVHVPGVKVSLRRYRAMPARGTDTVDLLRVTVVSNKHLAA